MPIGQCNDLILVDDDRLARFDGEHFAAGGDKGFDGADASGHCVIRLSLVEGTPGGSAASFGNPMTLRAAFTSASTRVRGFFILRFM